MDDAIQAKTDFADARRKAFLAELAAFLRRRSNDLLSWDQVVDKLQLNQQPIYRGLQRVRIEQIVGSVSRYTDFDRSFLPRTDSLEQRWASIARAYYSGAGLPPVQLYRLGEVYFVLDGHHRISVARQQGAEFIEAEVAEVQSRVPVAADLDADTVEIKGEYAGFIAATRLDLLYPDLKIELTTGGGYRRLQEQIALYRCEIDPDHPDSVSDEQAVRGWCEHVYRPLIQIIRDQEILAQFPGRTEADLCLWIMDHQHDLREQCGPDVDVERAAEHYARRYPAQKVKRALRAIQEQITGLDCERIAGDPEPNETPRDPQLS